MKKLFGLALKTAAVAVFVVLPLEAVFSQTGNDKFVPDRGQQTLVLASGSQSEVSGHFVFVARTSAALDKLSQLVRLPDVAFGTDFKKSAIVAAFAGTKPTGGYSVEIEAKDGTAKVSEVAPPEDAMVTEALTTPYSVAVVPVEEEESLVVKVPALWEEGAENYPILSGFFSVSGGFVATEQTFVVTGSVKVMRHGDLVTFLSIIAASTDQRRELTETVSAVKSDAVWIADRMEAGNFLERPHPPLRIKATFEGNWLKMAFEPGKRDYVVNDGYTAKGEIAAKRNPPVYETPPTPEVPPNADEPTPVPPATGETPPAGAEAQPPAAKSRPRISPKPPAL